MAEWSKAPDSSSGIARCVGSNPTECTEILFWTNNFVSYKTTIIGQVKMLMFLQEVTVWRNMYFGQDCLFMRVL